MKTYNYNYKNITKWAEETKNNLKSFDRNSLSVTEDLVELRGGRWKVKLIESKIVQSLFYWLRIDYIQHTFSSSYKADVQKALNDYLSDDEKKDKELIQSIVKDMRLCDKLIMAKPYEYFFLNLRHLSNEERKKYVTDKYMLQRMSMTGTRKLHDIELNEKYNFYLLAKPFFNRIVLLLNKDSKFEDFEPIALKLKKMIFKPTSLGCGGVFLWMMFLIKIM